MSDPQELFARIRADMKRNQYAEPEDTESLIAALEAVLALCDRFDDDEFFAGYELAEGCRAAAVGDTEVTDNNIANQWRYPEPDVAALHDRIAELEAELTGVRACLVEHGQRLAAVLELCDDPLHWQGLAIRLDVRAAATGDTK